MGWGALDYSPPHTLHQKPVSRQGNTLDHHSCKNKLIETKSISCVCIGNVSRGAIVQCCLFLCEFIFLLFKLFSHMGIV